jgi:uncharacterized protein with von Willebrand factor type A (vWA) domain
VSGGAPAATLERNVVAFAEFLRVHCGFGAGPRECIDALRALTVVGLAERTRVRDALRLVFCAAANEIEPFDRAFDAFFSAEPQGVAQERYAPRQTQPRAARQRERAPAGAGGEDAAPRSGVRAEAAADELGEGEAGLHERASAHAVRGDVLAVALDDEQQTLRAASAFLLRLRLGRSRRLHRVPDGGKLDFRATLRASLQTGGEPFARRWLGHPRRRPGVVVVIDGSRSMGALSDPMLRFAWALLQCSRDVAAFVFSTRLHDVTRALRASGAHGTLAPGHAPEAWGGGTQIGASLQRLARDHGSRVLDRDTVVVVFSDGLDVGEPAALRAALREIRRRTAGIVWLNPLAAQPGYTPAARGMHVALAYVDVFAPGDASSLLRLASHPRLRAVFAH